MNRISIVREGEIPCSCAVLKSCSNFYETIQDGSLTCSYTKRKSFFLFPASESARQTGAASTKNERDKPIATKSAFTVCWFLLVFTITTSCSIACCEYKQAEKKKKQRNNFLRRKNIIGKKNKQNNHNMVAKSFSSPSSLLVLLLSLLLLSGDHRHTFCHAQTPEPSAATMEPSTEPSILPTGTDQWNGCYDVNDPSALVTVGQKTTICFVIADGIDWREERQYLRLHFQPVADTYSRFHVPRCKCQVVVVFFFSYFQQVKLPL